MISPSNTPFFFQVAYAAKRFAILPGDAASIAYEITAKALDALIRQEEREEREKTSSCANSIPSTRDKARACAFVVYADYALFMRACRAFAPNFIPTLISSPKDIQFPGIYIVDIPIQSWVDSNAGTLCAASAKGAHDAILRAADDVKNAWIDGICTGPIHKGAMRLAHIDEIGHTEMLGKAFGVPNPITLFITRDLRIFFYSRHLSLRQAIDALDCDKIVAFAQSIHAHMKQLGFSSPKLALAALNPHASDGGQFGDEETRILLPAVQILRNIGIDISEPIGADSVFTLCARKKFNAVLSLYHDQGHIAAKTYDFERTISATLGLPVLRTSVDHGTALDIAWKGKAQAISMQTALEQLVALVR